MKRGQASTKNRPKSSSRISSDRSSALILHRWETRRLVLAKSLTLAKYLLWSPQWSPQRPQELSTKMTRSPAVHQWRSTTLTRRVMSQLAHRTTAPWTASIWSRPRAPQELVGRSMPRTQQGIRRRILGIFRSRRYQWRRRKRLRRPMSVVLLRSWEKFRRSKNLSRGDNRLCL